MLPSPGMTRAAEHVPAGGGRQDGNSHRALLNSAYATTQRMHEFGSQYYCEPAHGAQDRAQWAGGGIERLSVGEHAMASLRVSATLALRGPVRRASRGALFLSREPLTGRVRMM
jgi:hypothetical protein